MVRESQAWDCTFDFLATFYRFVIQLPDIIYTIVSYLLVVNVITLKPALNFGPVLNLSISNLLITPQRTQFVKNVFFNSHVTKYLETWYQHFGFLKICLYRILKIPLNQNCKSLLKYTLPVSFGPCFYFIHLFVRVYTIDYGRHTPSFQSYLNLRPYLRAQ